MWAGEDVGNGISTIVGERLPWVCRKGPQKKVNWGKEGNKDKMGIVQSFSIPYELGSYHFCHNGPGQPEGCCAKLCEVHLAFFLLLFLSVGSSRVCSQEREWLFSNRHL